MKEFIGKKVEFVLDGFDKPFVAKVVEDSPVLVLVQGTNDTRPRRIVKSKIVMFMPMEDVETDSVSLQVLACQNVKLHCPGVKFVQEGAGVKRADFDKFMGPCPKRTPECKCGTMGELRSMPGSKLRDMVAGTVFGDYPEVK